MMGLKLNNVDKVTSYNDTEVSASYYFTPWLLANVAVIFKKV